MAPGGWDGPREWDGPRVRRCPLIRWGFARVSGLPQSTNGLCEKPCDPQILRVDMHLSMGGFCLIAILVDFRGLPQAQWQRDWMACSAKWVLISANLGSTQAQLVGASTAGLLEITSTLLADFFLALISVLNLQ